MATIKLVGSAGYYAGCTSGRRVEVELQTTHYGDRGWMALVDGQPVTDYPRRTRAEALAVAVATATALGSPLVKKEVR